MNIYICLSESPANSVGQNESSLDDIVQNFNNEYTEWKKNRDKIPEDGNNVAGDMASSAGSTGRHGGSGRGPSKPRRETTGSELPDHEIHGFQNEILALKHFLLKKKDSQEFKTLAIVGKHGVGKTALCQKVFNDEDIMKEYLPRIWVSMYKAGEQEDDDPKTAIVKRLLKNLGVEQEALANIKDDDTDEIARKVDAGDVGKEALKMKELSRQLSALHEHLWGKKYLIVLDDVHKEDKWNERLDEKRPEEKPEDKKWEAHLSSGFPKGLGGRVIFTSSDEKLAMELVGKEENLHRLYPLSDPESCWNVYLDAEKKFNHTVVRPRKPKKSRQELMNKSGGIPLVVRMMGMIKPVEVKSSQEDQADERTESSHGKDDPKTSEQEGTDEVKTAAAKE